MVSDFTEVIEDGVFATDEVKKILSIIKSGEYVTENRF
ncbi:Uncharacterized protein dnm_069540 [Desulfonema magnum]|uniref:Uncharacterized protein n=1 Tax=Desulfonema magnum TaxID=45655 RepID=A0A975BSG2_9BACT|nr:Uncharacterized protein dnm_069540 [Desulfonema magnum]